MSKQRTDLAPNPNQKRILDLEKKYFEIIEQIINSEDFLTDLKHIERETKTKDYYQKYGMLKTKLKFHVKD